MNNNDCVIKKLEDLSYNFSFVSELKVGENLQPTCLGRYLLRGVSWNQNNPIQITLEVFASMTEAYSPESFNFVITHYTQELGKIRDIFNENVVFSESSPFEIAAKLACRNLILSRVGFTNWKQTLKDKNLDDIDIRLAKIDTLITEENAIIDEIILRVGNKMESMLNNLSLDHTLLKDCFQEELALLIGLQDIGYDRLEDFEALVKTHGDRFAEIIQEKQNLSRSTLYPLAYNTLEAKDATKRLDAYVQCWSPNVTLDQARFFCEEGKKLYQAILENKITPRANEKDIAALTWFLMRLAIDKGQGHEEGAFSIEDKNNCLYNYLLSAEGTGDRPSSHYIGRSPKWTGATKFVMQASAHKGVDVISEPLPNRKRHILFGKVDAPHGGSLLFIKLEAYSPYVTTSGGYDLAMHGAELCIAQYNKLFYPGSDDLKEMAKERVPAKLLKEFSLHASLEEKKLAKIWGISYMAKFLGMALELNEHDHVEKRTGREVYLTLEEIENALSK